MSTEHTTSFAPSGEDAITRTIEIQEESGPSEVGVAFEEFYEIERTAEELAKGGYQRIALQFPDELLHDSVPIFRRLKRRISEIRKSLPSSSSSIATSTQESTSRTESTPAASSNSTKTTVPNGGASSAPEQELYVLADTSYGSCCVDEVAAQHVNADALVHYGHACMTLTSRLPVIYVFGQKSLPGSVEGCVSELLRVFDENSDSTTQEDSKSKAILLKHDVAYTYLADAILTALQEALAKRQPDISRRMQILYNRIPTSSLPMHADVGTRTKTEEAKPDTGAANSAAAEENIQLEHMVIFYIGGESLGLTNLLMTNSGREVYTYDPRTTRAVLASGRTNRLLMRRYAAVQKARDADVFAILVGTLGVASYLPLISHLRRLLARRRKKSYTISVGKLNPAKLANFLEVECFILVACPENSLVEGEKDFLRPIVTPYEFEVAMQAEQSWTGRYVLDFGRLLADAKKAETAEAEAASDDTSKPYEDGDESDPDQPVYSLVTGTYRHAKQYGGGKHGGAVEDDEVRRIQAGTSALVLRNQDDQVARMDSAAGQFLQQRSYQGLELRLGEDAPSVLEQGRSGIARGYQDDREHQDMVTTTYKG